MKLEVGPMPPKQALEYWKSRIPIAADDFTQLEKDLRRRAISVAGLTRTEQVEAVHKVLLESKQEGLPLQQCRKRLRELFSAEDAPAGLLKRHRIDTIVRTNTQTCYQAGRYSQMQAVAEERPVWRYSAVRDRRTRPEHAALHGKCYPASHEFWDQYYPPNGFNCRCTVSTLTEDQAVRRGYTVDDELPGSVEVVNKQTGEVKRVLPAPDPGFGRNPGKDWLHGLTPAELEDVLEPFPLPLSTLCRDGKGLFAGQSCKIPLGDIDQRHILEVKEADLLSKSLSKEAQVEAFLQEFGLKGIKESLVHRLPGNYPVVISKWLFFDKASGKIKPTWTDKGPYMRLLARTIQSPYEVWWQPVEIGKHKRLVFSLKCIRLFREQHGKEIGGYASFSLLGGRYWQGATAFSPRAGRSRNAILKNLEKEREGILLYREALE